METQLILKSIIFASNLVQQVSSCKKNVCSSRMPSICYSLLWFNRECKKHVRRKKRLYSKAKRTDLDIDWFRIKDRARKTCKKASLLNCINCELIASSRASVPSMLACSRVNVPCIITCQRVFRAYALTHQCPLCAYVITCKHALPA